jgi:vancomycin permeability regulator SanA
VHVDEKAIIRYDDLFSRKRFCIVGQEYHLNQAKCLHTNHVQLPNSAPLHVDHVIYYSFLVVAFISHLRCLLCLLFFNKHIRYYGYFY